MMFSLWQKDDSSIIRLKTCNLVSKCSFHVHFKSNAVNKTYNILQIHKIRITPAHASVNIMFALAQGDILSEMNERLLPTRHMSSLSYTHIITPMFNE